MNKDTYEQKISEFHNMEIERLKAENERLSKALMALLKHYTVLVNSGDAGNWDAEKEDVVIMARKALSGGK